MALSEETIKANYNQAIAKADELDRLSTKMNTEIAAEVDSISSGVNQAWQGDQARDYIGKCSSAQSYACAIGSEMSSVASAIRTMAKNVYDAEMRALERARAEEAARRERERREREAREAAAQA